MKRFLSLAALLAALAPILAAQPQFKTQEEFDGFVAIQNAPSLDARIEAGTAFLTNFPESEAKGLAAYMVMLSYQGQNDFENMLIYGDETLNSTDDPGVTVGVLVSLSNAIPNRTREFDLDKEEKLSKAEDYAKRAMTMIPMLQKVDPNLSDDDWLLTKKNFMAQCHESLGLVAVKREDFPAAEESLRKSLDLSSEPVPSTLYNLGFALQRQGKNDEAANIADRCVAAGGYPNASADLCGKLKAGPPTGAGSP